MTLRADKPTRLPARARRWYVVGTVVAIWAALGFFHHHILAGFAFFMTIRDPLEPADLILVLNHEGDTIPFGAAALYDLGYAGHIALVRSRPSRLESLGLLQPRHEVWQKVIEGEGVPPKAILTIGSNIRNSVEIGQALAALARKSGMKRIIVVASAPLSRISRNDLLRGLVGSRLDIRLYPVKPRKFDERTWWQTRDGWVTYFDVYCLWLVRFFREWFKRPDGTAVRLARPQGELVRDHFHDSYGFLAFLRCDGRLGSVGDAVHKLANQDFVTGPQSSGYEPCAIGERIQKDPRRLS